MSTKYVFLDIDGTLVGADGRVPDSTMKAIIQARKMDIRYLYVRVDAVVKCMRIYCVFR